MPTDTFVTVADAPLREADPDTVSGGFGDLEIGWLGATARYHSVVKFDLSSLPGDAQISAATLRLYKPGTDSFTALNYNVYANRATSMWDEATITWNKRPTFTTTGRATLYDQGGTTGWREWDVLTIVQEWVNNGVANHGFYLDHGHSGTNNQKKYDAKEKTNGRPAQLVITYTTNQAPNAPTGLSPSGGATIDRDAVQRFSWTFSDPDAGDSQSAADLRYRPSGSTTWTTINITSTNTYHDFAAGTFAAGDYEWQVRTYDAQGVVGPYSTSAYFTAASAPAAPTITDPVNGQTIAAEDYTVHWSAPNQDAYQVRTVADNAGAPDATTVYTDTGTVESTTARSRTVSFPVNNRDEHIQVRIRLNGLWSTWASVRVTISYTPPATPTVAATPDVGDGTIAVSWTNPAPAAGEPTVTAMRVYRTTDGGAELLLAVVAPSSSPYLDATAGAQADHVYRVVAVGDNGTTTSSASTAPVRLALNGSWLHPAGDPAARRQYRRNEDGGDRTRTVEQARRRFAGRALPVVEYGEGRSERVAVSLHLTDDTELDALLALEGRIVCYRDAKGRRLFGTLGPIADAGAFYGWVVDLEVSAVDHDETVSP